MKTQTQHKQQKKEKTFSMKKSKKQANRASDDHLQQIPQRLREIMKSKERMNMSSRQRRKASRSKLKTGEGGDIPVPHFRRGRRESEKSFIQRMTQESEHVLFLTNNQNHRKPEKQLKNHEEPPQQKKSTKKGFNKAKLKLEKKKLVQREKREEEEMFTDEVQFGEVAMAPPSLSVKPKKAAVKSQGAPKGLLLNSLLGHSSPSVKPSMARKRMMEEERERVVQLYREMKKNRETHTSRS